MDQVRRGYSPNGSDGGEVRGEAGRRRERVAMRSVVIERPGRSGTRPEPLYRAVIAAALAVLKLRRWDVAVSGAEHIPTAGPAIIASNHIGYLDFVFLG